MTVTLSAFGGAGAQFFDANGDPLSGGQIFSYVAGTTTPQAAYTDALGLTPHSNPIILNAAGRISSGEIWLSAGQNYKFVLASSTGVLIATYDNITGINGTGITTTATSVSFTGFKGQTGFVQDIADSDGSNWIGFNQPTTSAVARSAQDKMADFVSVRDFGAAGDGVIDDSSAFVNALTYIASSARLIGGYKTAMPALYIPNGRYRITQKAALTSAFQVGGLFYGISYFGDGRNNTTIYYDSTDTAADNYLASFRNCWSVSFSDLSFEFSGAAVLRGIEWFGGSGPQGSIFSAKNVSVAGNYVLFFNVTGTSLGSETYWENILSSGPITGATFFNVASNAQSVNHLFINCSIGCAGGTIFNFNAGGNFKWYGGYTSFIGTTPGTFLNISGSGATIGSSNNDFLIDGWHPETSVTNTTARILTLNADAVVTFRACNFEQPSYTAGHYPFVIGQVNQQRSGSVNFLTCTGVSKGLQLNGGVTVAIDNCPTSLDWQNFTELNASTVSNLYEPILTIRNTPNVGFTTPNPKDCRPFAMERVTGGVTNTLQQLNGQTPFVWVARSNTGGAGGLRAGYNSAYTSFTCKLPLGSVLKKVVFKYVRNGDVYPAANRTYKITDSTGATVFMAPTTFAGAGPTTVISADLWYVVSTEAARDIVISGFSTTGSSPGATHNDVGYVMLEYA